MDEIDNFERVNHNPDFLEALMKHILDQRKVPKVQVERAIGPILGFFIEEVLSLALNDNLRMVCAEFPLRKSDTRSNQSTNIDWLLFSPLKRQLVFVELKTTVGFDREQFERYCAVIRTVKGRADHLLEDVRRIRKHSRKKPKYDQLLEILQGTPFPDCTSAKLVYITPVMPNSEVTIEDVHVDWFRLGDLRVRDGFRFSREWTVIQSFLAEFGTLEAARACARSQTT